MLFQVLEIEQKTKLLNEMTGSLFKSVFLLDYVSIIGILLPKISNDGGISVDIEKLVSELAKSVLIDVELH